MLLQRCLPSSNNLVLVIKTRRLPHSLDYLEHTHPFTLSKVVGPVPRGVRATVEHFGIRSEGLQCEKVALGEVHDVQIITNTCTVTIQSNEQG